jgi:ubiquitin C-terminal hydrolase
VTRVRFFFAPRFIKICELCSLTRWLLPALGINDGWQSRPSVAADIPVGLTNIANTCYLNSLLQVSVSPV